MDLRALPEMVDGLPNICGAEAQVKEVTSQQQPVYLHDTDLRFDRIQSCFAIALHMQQPLIPAGGSDLQNAEIISNLDYMMRGADSYNAAVFADCYGRMGDIIPELVHQGRSPRVMFDYSGELFYGLRKMGRGDVLDRLRGITCDPHLRRYAEWLGTMWGHAVASSTPPADYILHIRAWQQHFAAVFGWEALGRVRGFSPPEMHLPNHPDVTYEYVKALKECGYRWLLVQEHSVETPDGRDLRASNVHHLPCRLAARNSQGEEVSIIGIIKTQGSDTKLVAQMQPLFEARGLHRREVGRASIPPIVTQIGDGENGGVMMNEFPSGYRSAIHQLGTEGTVMVNATEYLELLEAAGVREQMLPIIQPVRQAQVFARIKSWQPGAADQAIAEVRKDQPHFSMDGGCWTDNISWVRGYENVLGPMDKLSAQFHQVMDHRFVDKNSPSYRNALFHLLMVETSCFRYWGQGVWTDYAREICRRGTDILTHDFQEREAWSVKRGA